MNYILTFLSVVALMAIVDVCYAKYTLEIAKHRPKQSAAWSSAIILAGSMVTISYVHDKSLVLAAAIGAAIGTYYTVKKESNGSKQES